jgi:hypothetical protein
MVNDGIRILMTKAGTFLDKAVAAREAFYQGMDEAAAGFGDPKLRKDARYRFGESVQAKQLIADNKWHMAQARTWSLMAVGKGIYVLIAEQQRTNKLLEENNTLLKEVRNALRGR